MHASPFLPKRSQKSIPCCLTPAMYNQPCSWQQLCSKLSRSEKRRGFVWIRHLSFEGQGSSPGKANTSILLNPWTLSLYYNLSQTLRCKSTSKQNNNKVYRAVQWMEWKKYANGAAAAGYRLNCWAAEPVFLQCAWSFLSFSPKVRLNSDLESLFP